MGKVRGNWERKRSGQGKENVKGNKEGRERGIRRRHFDLCSGPKRAIPALCNNEKKKKTEFSCNGTFPPLAEVKNRARGRVNYLQLNGQGHSLTGRKNC